MSSQPKPNETTEPAMATANEEANNQPDTDETAEAVPVDILPESDTDADTSPPTSDNVAELFQKLEEATNEVEAYKNRCARAIADLENFRKRSIREKDETRRMAINNVIGDLLPAFDNLNLGLESARAHHEAHAVVDGFAMVLTQINNILSQYGIVEINPLGDEFDPNLHDCIAHQPNPDVPEDKVIAVTRKGYMIGDRLVRAASVIVSSGPPEEKAEGTDEAPGDAPESGEDDTNA